MDHEPNRKLEEKPQITIDFNQYLETNLRYPKVAKRKKIEGEVIIAFKVNEQGNITEPKIVQSLGFGCDQEALRLVKILPTMKPARIMSTDEFGERRQTNVSAYDTIIISFYRNK